MTQECLKDFMNLCSSIGDIDLKTITICALSQKTRSDLSKGLNNKKLTLSECGDQRDWRGIAKNFGFPQFSPSTGIDPTEELLSLLCSQPRDGFTLGRFQEILLLIDRSDVYEDTLAGFCE